MDIKIRGNREQRTSDTRETEKVLTREGDRNNNSQEYSRTHNSTTRYQNILEHTREHE